MTSPIWLQPLSVMQKYRAVIIDTWSLILVLFLNIWTSGHKVRELISLSPFPSEIDVTAANFLLLFLLFFLDISIYIKQVSKKKNPFNFLWYRNKARCISRSVYLLEFSNRFLHIRMNTVTLALSFIIANLR